MNRHIGAVLLLIGSMLCGRVIRDDGKQIVLPNPKLIGCRLSACSQLWQDKLADTNTIYPKQLSMDIQGSCPTGIVARYDKSVSLQEIKAAIDQHFGKWAAPENGDLAAPVNVWRVEPEHFAIQLAAVDKEMETMTLGQVLSQPQRARGKVRATEDLAKQVIYLAFAGTKCDDK